MDQRWKVHGLTGIALIDTGLYLGCQLLSALGQLHQTLEDPRRAQEEGGLDIAQG